MDEPIVDAWSPLSFKRVLGSKNQPGFSWVAPTWVGEHKRRLAAYQVLQAYLDNSSRYFLNTTDQVVMDDHREYGDAALMRNVILAALLGDDQEIFVDGADDFHPDDDEPETDPSNPTGGNEDGNPDAEAAWQLQEWLRGWAWTDERLGLKMLETERNSVGLGDGVYVLGVDNKKGRVRLRVFDPGFYFPVLTDSNEDEFPVKVHIAWELESDKPGERLVRRITWELAELEEARTYEWNDEPSYTACLMTDATWSLQLTQGNGPDDFTGASATYETVVDENGDDVEVRDLDLGFDFIPVIHVPNTVAIQNHYGQSSLATVLQILDDLANADTDLQASSATTGKPPIALGGVTVKTNPTYKPGEIWAIGDGNATMIDTSKALVALTGYVEHLLKRLSVNGRVPEAVLGRVDPSDVASGIALALSFGPLQAMISEMRLVRDEKYPLLLRFVWRMSIAAGFDDVPGRWFDSHIELGSYLPSDQAAAVKMVTELLNAKAISLETGVQILIGAGLPIEDVIEEVVKIQERDFEGAGLLLEVTGDEDAVFEYLGRERPPEVAPTPQPPAPAVPGQPDVIAVPGTQRAEPTQPVAPQLPEA